MKKVEVLKENGNYNIDIVDGNKYLAGVIVDLKRYQYYLVLPEGHDEESVDFLINNIINKIALREYNKEKNDRVGDIKTYSEEIIIKELSLIDSSDKIKINNLGILKEKNNVSISRHLQ